MEVTEVTRIHKKKNTINNVHTYNLVGRKTNIKNKRVQAELHRALDSNGAGVRPSALVPPSSAVTCSGTA